MMRYTDERNRRFPTDRPTGAAFLSQEEMKEQSRKTIEREIVKQIAKEFRLNLRVIGEAVKNETTEFDYLLLGLHRAYAPQFPASIHVAKPQRGKGQVFTLNRLLLHPEKYSLVGHFLALHSENLHRSFRPAMLAGIHPRLGLLVVTDLKMEPDILCFQFSVALARGNKTLNLAEIKHLLRAIHRQGLWLPEAR
jgi:hypothetical protein